MSFSVAPSAFAWSACARQLPRAARPRPIAQAAIPTASTTRLAIAAIQPHGVELPELGADVAVAVWVWLAVVVGVVVVVVTGGDVVVVVDVRVTVGSELGNELRTELRPPLPPPQPASAAATATSASAPATCRWRRRPPICGSVGSQPAAGVAQNG
jgi:hypothetical protein